MQSKKIYIVGKVTGEPIAHCTMKFGAVQKFYEELGFKVVNPLAVVGDWKTPWQIAMKMCISELINCDALVLLDDWENSKGAKIERQLADDLEILIVKNTKLGVRILMAQLM